MNAHAILSASGASRWLECPPSARFEEQIPEQTSDFAEEGTLAHEFADIYLRARAGLHEGPISFEGLEDSPHFDSVMHDHADNWAEFVKGFGGQIFAEQRLDFSEWIHLGYGRTDAMNLNDGTIYISDFKYGLGIPVSAEKNRQMMCYGLGGLKKAREIGFKAHTVVLSVFQPRLNSSSSWTISADDLLAWADTIADTAKLAISGQGNFSVGSHCRFCKARTVCSAFYDKYAELLQIDDSRKLSADNLDTVLSYGDVLTKWVKDVKEATAERMKANGKVPGWKLVRGQNVRFFKDELEVIERLLAAEDVDLDKAFTEPKLLTLAQLEKLIGKKEFNNLFADQVAIKEGNPKIVPESDKRPGIGASAADDFDDDYEDLL